MSEKRVVLYVDDESINTFLFERNFENQFAIFTAESGEEGLKALAANPGIQIVISGMRMSGMDGVEFITKAKAIFPNIVYFLLTSSDPSNEIINAVNNKIIQQFIRKPFNKEDLEKAIQDVG